MKKLGLGIVLALIAFIWLHKRPSDPEHSVRAEVNQDDEPQVVKSPPKPKEAHQIIPPSPPSPVTNTAVSDSPSEQVFPTKDEFARDFKKRDFREWLKEATPLKDMVDPAGGLHIIHEGGIIRTIANEEIQYRYNMSGTSGRVGEMSPDSCSSLQLPNGKIVLGAADESNLSVWLLPKDVAFLIGVQDKYFFVRYFDATKSRGRDEYGAPRNPLTTLALLYYVRQEEGKITYQGQIEKLTSPDPNLRLNAKDFCQYSYADEYK